MADGKTMPKGKGKGKGKKEGGRSGGGDDDAAPAAKNGGKGAEELEGFVTSVDGTEGVVNADLPEGGGVEVRVKFSPAPPGKGSVKDGKKEVKFKSIAVLAAPAPAGEAGWEAEPAPTGDTDAEAPAQHEAPQPPGEKQGKERVIRDDDECFVADYTGAASNQPRTPKFEQFDKVRRARIARELVDIDPEVELRIRKHPSKDAEEIRVITAEDTVEVVGTCGEWLRLAGNDEQWIKYLQSENPDIPEQLVDVLGPSILSVASSLTSGWFSSGAAAPQDDESSAGGAAEDAKAGARGGGGGWGFGGWGKSLSSYVPLDTVSALSSRVLAAGGEGAGPAGGDGSLSDALREAQTEGESNQDIAAELTESVEKKFDKEVKLDDGGLASVRMASQAISMFEGSLGWLSSSATTAAATVQEKAKTVRETVTSEEFVDKAWSNVKSGVQAGGSVAVSATKIASSTTSAVVNSGAVNRVTAMGKSAISSVGSTSGKLISSAKTTLLGCVRACMCIYAFRVWISGVSLLRYVRMWMHVCMLACVHVPRIWCHSVWSSVLGFGGQGRCDEERFRRQQERGSEEGREGQVGRGVVGAFVCRLHNAYVPLLTLPSLSPSLSLSLSLFLSLSLSLLLLPLPLCPSLSISISARREDEVDETRVYPNRALGGVVAIELRCPTLSPRGVRACVLYMRACMHAARSSKRNNRIELSLASAHTCSGCIIARDPHVEDEDEDPFLSDDYRFVLYTCRQRQAMRAMETRGAAMHETTCAMEEGGTVHRQWTRERVTVKRTSLSLSLPPSLPPLPPSSPSLPPSLSLSPSLSRTRSRTREPQ